MNVVFRLKTPEMEENFVKEAKAAGIVGVKGHRSTGGIRFSIYNANLVKNVKVETEFMGEFCCKNHLAQSDNFSTKWSPKVTGWPFRVYNQYIWI